jgi:hypothetical protein
MTTMRALGLVLVLLAVPCCTGDAAEEQVPAGDTIASAWGQELCVETASDTRLEGDTTVHVGTFECTLETEDPRATGQEIIEIETILSGSTGTWTGESTLTTEEGSWTGTANGVVSTAGAGNTNLGEVDYRGEGAYEGLEMTAYVHGSDQELSWAAWIRETP